jgi:hypothetical protein
MFVGPLGGLALIRRAACQRVVDSDPLDDENPVFHLDVTFGRRDEVAAARIDPARLQRATQGPGQSTSGGRDHVVKGRGVWLERSGRGLVVLRHLIVYSEKNRRGLGRHKRLSQRALDPLDANL